MEIPGFYYDEVKKKYFKIQSGTWNSSDHPYKKDNLKKQQLSKNIKTNINNHKNNILKSKKSLPWCQDFADVLYQREIGILPMSTFSRFTLLNQGSELTLKSSGSNHYFADSSNSILKSILPHQNQAIILQFQNLHTSHFVKCRYNHRNLKSNFKFKSKNLNLNSPMMNVRSFHWLNENALQLCVLEYIADGPSVDYQDKSYLSFLTPNTEEESSYQVNRQLVNNFGVCNSFIPVCSNNKIFCCYNSAVEILSIDHGISRLKWRSFKDKRKLLSVETLGDRSSSSHVIVGSRDHGIFLYDTKQNLFKESWQVRKNVDKGICKMISVPESDYQFISASFEGNIRLWDIRSNKESCLTYQNGIHNSFTVPPLSVDEMSQYLMASGENCALHIWNVKCGDLIQIIDPVDFLNENQLSLEYRPQSIFCPLLRKSRTCANLDLVAFTKHCWVYYSK